MNLRGIPSFVIGAIALATCGLFIKHAIPLAGEVHGIFEFLLYLVLWLASFLIGAIGLSMFIYGAEERYSPSGETNSS